MVVMVPSLRFLPRWWVGAAALLAVSLCLALAAHLLLLALVAGRGADRPPPQHPGRPRCPGAFPERACPAVAQALLALHCKAANRTVYELHLAELFPAHMERAKRRHEQAPQSLEFDYEEEDGGGRGDGEGGDISEDRLVGPAGTGHPQQQGHDMAGAPPGEQAQRRQRPRRHGTRPADTTTTMVCYLLVTLLIASAALAIGEVLREWWTSLANKSRRGKL